MLSPISILLILLLSFPILSLSDPRISEADLRCGTNVTGNPVNVSNFITTMEMLSQETTVAKWGTAVSGVVRHGYPVFGLAHCYFDLSPTDCLLCFGEARTRLPRCLPSTSGHLFLDGCFLRYERYNFFHEFTNNHLDAQKCGGLPGVEGEKDQAQLSTNVELVVQRVTEMAVNGRELFGIGESVEGKHMAVYGLGQCWRTLSTHECQMCLEKAAKEVKKCLPWREGRGLNAGCYMRYSTKRFYNDEQASRRNGRKHMLMIVVITSLVTALSLFSICGVCVGYKRISKGKRGNEFLGRHFSSTEKSALNFKYETLEKATNFFSLSRKVGQGGSGSVYKGVLRGGRTVAVKRLFFNSRQWVEEFFNEVNLISGVQHKNLVKLLGCSIEGPESLLVYEFLPNKSLDNFLFDKDNTQTLSWQQRFDIIVGIAEGLEYLHEGSMTKIIHRDIKASNILLDENLKAKIADFGLARCVGPDKTHLSTGIAGTLGYMAPEYLVRGQLTEKADVYSFGVLVLEIVCGRKNSVYSEESGSVLHMVWKHYKSHTLSETVDNRLNNHFPLTLASNVLQIGLLCTQASVSLRPSMSEVVQMLTNKHYSIPLPMQPPFLSSSVADRNASTDFSNIPSSSSITTSDGHATSASESIKVN